MKAYLARSSASNARSRIPADRRSWLLERKPMRRILALLVTLIPLFLPISELSAQAPVSDDFNSTTLNTSVWTFVNPVGNGSYSLNGGKLRLSVPAGSVHDVWTTGDN